MKRSLSVSCRKPGRVLFFATTPSTSFSMKYLFSFWKEIFLEEIFRKIETSSAKACAPSQFARPTRYDRMESVIYFHRSISLFTLEASAPVKRLISLPPFNSTKVGREWIEKRSDKSLHWSTSIFRKTTLVRYSVMAQRCTMRAICAHGGH